MTDWRSEFPVTAEWSYLDHAAVAPLSARARDRLRVCADDFAASGVANEGDWWREIEVARTGVARLLGATPEEIAFTPNTSAGLAMVAEGFPWRDGDNVVVPVGEYPANLYPWMHLASRGVSLKQVPLQGMRVAVDDIAAAIDSRTRLVSISHVQYSTGFRIDLAKVGDLCGTRGVDFCVDGIQGVGVFPYDVHACNIDYLAADGHKWLLSPEGAGILYVRKEKLEKLRPTSIGWKSVVGALDFGKVDFRLKPDASRFEPGTYNTPGIVGLGASVGLLLEVGMPAVRDRIRETTNYLVEKLQSAGAVIASPRGEGEWSGIVSFTWPKGDPVDLTRFCKSQKVMISCRAGRLRASPHFYNTRDDVDRLINVLGAC